MMLYRFTVVMLSIVAAISCFLVTTAQCTENTSIAQMVMSVDCSKQHGHVDLTVPACPYPSAVQCPACTCLAQMCPACTCQAQLCPVQQCPTSVVLPRQKVATPTGSGYEWFPGLGHYKFHPYGATWGQGQEHCLEEGAHLIVINSQREAQVVITLFGHNPTMPGAEQTGWAWTGVRERGGNGNYVTLTGEPLSATGFSFWSPTEPNDGGPNDCVLTHRLNALLADAACTRVFAFICELEL